MKKAGMRSTAARRQRLSKGSVMVETALVFTVFAAMLISIFDFGQFLFIHQALVERARYAARWGSINDPTDSASIVNMILYNQSSTPASGTPAYLNLSSSNISVTNPNSGTNDYRLNVQISGYSYTIFSLFIAGTYTGIPITVSVPLGTFD